MSICRTAVLTAGTCESLSQGLDGEGVDGEVLEKGTKQIVALLEVRDIRRPRLRKGERVRE